MSAPQVDNSSQITFLTRHYPPSPNINGESVWDLVHYLEEQHGLTCEVLCIDRKADGGGAQREPRGQVTRLWTPYQGQYGPLRFLAFLWDGFLLAWRARSRRHNLVLCTTSPPLLPFWCSLLLPRNTRWVVWYFDLFPEFFAVTGKIKPTNPIYRWVKRMTYRRPPEALIALGPQQALHLQQLYGQAVPDFILPCGIPYYQDRAETPPSWYDPAYTHLGYCGNLGDAHNPDFVKAVIDALDPNQYRLVLALYGPKAETVRAYAQGKPGVILVDRVPRNQLHFIDVHLVSLIRSWTHIAVPSKAVSAIAANAAMLFCGDPHSDNWHLLQQAGWLVNEEQPLPPQVEQFFKQLTPESLAERKAATPDLVRRLREYVLTAYEQVRGLAQGQAAEQVWNETRSTPPPQYMAEQQQPEG